ncbi:hypothetical protein BJX65DRAFT_190314 [Aspergillus insuetus]
MSGRWHGVWFFIRRPTIDSGMFLCLRLWFHSFSLFQRGPKISFADSDSESHVFSTTSTVENPGRARLLEPVQNMFAYRDGRLDPNLLSQPLCQATALVKSVRGDVCLPIQYCLCCLLHAWCFCTFIIRVPVYLSGLEKATYSSAARFSDVLRPGLKLTCRLFAL